MQNIDSETGEVIARGYSRSAEIKDLMKALAETQAEIENVEKVAANEQFKKRDGTASKYTTLGIVLDEVRPKLSSHGLAVCQMPINGDGNNIGVITLLAHAESGQWIDSTLYVSPTRFDAQGAGSVITYLRRYALMAMVGLAPEDDDGNAASVAAPIGRAEAPGARDRLQQKLRGGNGASAPPTEAREHYRRIQKEIDEARDFAELNETGIFGPEAEEAKRLIEQERGGAEAWKLLIERDTSRRMILAGPEGDIVA